MLLAPPLAAFIFLLIVVFSTSSFSDNGKT
jgi:hypothetical protein